MAESLFTVEGIERIAEITIEAKGKYSYRYFSDLTGISYGTLRNLVNAENQSIDYPTLEKLADYTTYTFEELLAIGMGEVETRPDRVLRVAEDVLPFAKELSDREVARLIGLLAGRLAGG